MRAATRAFAIKLRLLLRGEFVQQEGFVKSMRELDASDSIDLHVATVNQFISFEVDVQLNRGARLSVA